MNRMTTPAKVCPDCGSVLIAEKYDTFCDKCKDKIIDGDGMHRVVVFWKSGDNADTYEMCSWDCVIEWLREMKLNKRKISFITLPYISGSAHGFEWDYESFMRAISGEPIEEDDE